MVKIIDTLRSINAYPVPASVIMTAAITNGVDTEREFTKEAAQSRELNLCKAQLLEWLAGAPNISQGGQSYSFSPDERKQFKTEAASLRAKYDGEETNNTIYGYKGSKL